MLTAERRRVILTRLERDGKVVASELVGALGVSEDTVRRDLRELASGGLVQRVHGGALLPPPANVSFEQRLQLSTEAKAHLAQAALPLLEGANVVLLDGTFYRDDEMAVSGLGAKRGRRMGHLPMTGAGGTLDLMRALAPRRRLYTHLNNSNPVLVAGSPERLHVEAAGVEIAHDGMEIAL